MGTMIFDSALNAMANMAQLAELFVQYEASQDTFERLAISEQMAVILGESSAPVAVASDGLGQFSDDVEGVKALRDAASGYWRDNLQGQSVLNGSLNRKVGFNKTGRKKVLSFSADARKLQMLPALKQLIKTATKYASKLPLPNDNNNEVKRYFYMVAMVTIDELITPVRFVLRETNEGVLHYDHSLARPLAKHVLTTVKEKGPAEASPVPDADSEGPSQQAAIDMGGNYPDNIFDDAGGGVNAAPEVVNLFIGELAELEADPALQDEDASEPADEDLSDDPSADNYRYKDTGYIADSRKERAASQIKLAKEEGRQLRATDIDWDAVERNPRAAKDLIVKSNLFGAVDWESLRGNGMESGAGFLVDRVYASIATEPADSPESRKDYAAALETIRMRLEGCKTPADVTAVLEEIKEELLGKQLNESESAAYTELAEQLRALQVRNSELRREREALTKPRTDAIAKLHNLEWDQRKRELRGWKPDPELSSEAKT